MDIYEDDIFTSEKHSPDSEDELSYLPDEELTVDSEKPDNRKEEKNKTDDVSDTGMRIIYRAPEKSKPKREFTGFRDEDESLIREEETEEIAGEEATKTTEYKGGYDFEEEMKKNVRTAARKPAVRVIEPKSSELSLEEEKRRRYIESLKRAREEEAAAEKEGKTAQKSTRRTVIIDHEIEDIKIKDKKSTSEKIRLTVLVIAIIAMAASIAVLLKQYIQQKQVEDWENEVTGLLIDVEEDTTKKHKKKKKNEPETESTTQRVLTIEEQWEQLYRDYPNVQFPEGLSLKYAKLYAVNQDFVGYIAIDNFGVGLPVVQSKKDKKDENYYLRKSFYKKYSIYGCPFVPKNNDMANLDRNTVIYGHNNNSNIAFAPVNKYKTLDGYKAAPIIQFDTIYAPHKWKIIAAFIINTKAEDDNGYIFNYTFTKMSSNEEFMNYISFVKERSLYDTGVDVLPDDKILTLSTCSHDFDDARFVVVARLVRPGETEEVNTSVAHKNEKPRYPQAYYDKKNKKNPYKKSEKWFYSGE